MAVPITSEELVREFGRLTDAQGTSIFVGAGLSMSAGLPSWSDLLKGPRRQARVPARVTDLPLVAEYIAQNSAGGVAHLRDQVISATARTALQAAPSASHRLLAQLPVEDVWTTNYDDLIERAIADAVVVATDEHLVEARERAGKRVIKLHGGMVVAGGVHAFVDPIITRSDFEDFENLKPRLWSYLRSTYLTKSILFLGISFDDPNVELMLRLARSLRASREHYTVMRRPSSDQGRRLHELRVHDLGEAGIEVHEIDDFNEIQLVLAQLVRRTRSPTLFVSGSDAAGLRDSFYNAARAIGSRLAELPISINSLAGPAAGALSAAFARTIRQEDAVDAANRIRFYFNAPTRGSAKRPGTIGTQIYTQQDRLDLLATAMAECRAMLVLGGGGRTEEEVSRARALGLPVVPVAATGGYAERFWERETVATSGIPVPAAVRDMADRHWRSLAQHDDVNAVALAAHRFVKWANYVE
jgi:hypothetical protein